MKTVVEWSEWVGQIRQDVDPLEDRGEPARFDADGRRLDPDLFLDLLGELESRGVSKGSLVAVVSPRQVAGLLVEVDFLDRRPADAPDELPEDMTLYGVPVRAEVGFPAETLVMFDPRRTMLDGTAVDPNGVGVVENMSVPDLSDAGIYVEDVRESLFSDASPRGSTAEDGEDAPEEPPDPERKGSRFVETPDEEA